MTGQYPLPSALRAPSVGAGFAAAQITMAPSFSASRIGGYAAINAGGNEAAGAVANGGVNGTTLIRSGVMGASAGDGLISLNFSYR